jgi:hypothetical protein
VADAPYKHPAYVKRLDATGLYYYNARYYDPQIGRFISPDPITHSQPLPIGQIIKGLTVCCTSVKYYTGQTRMPATINPQEHNRYSYALNNPLRYIDPDGHQADGGVMSAMLQIAWNWHWTGEYVAPPAGIQFAMYFPVWYESMSAWPMLPDSVSMPKPASPPGMIKTETVASSQTPANSQSESKANILQKSKTAGEVIINTFLGCFEIIGGTILIEQGSATAIGDTIGSEGTLWWLFIPMGGIVAAQGYNFISAGTERISYGTIRLPRIPWLPSIPSWLNN